MPIRFCNIVSFFLPRAVPLVVFLLVAPPSMALTTVDCSSDPNALQDELDINSDFEYEINGTCTGGADGRIDIFGFNGFTRLMDDANDDAVIDADILVSGPAEVEMRDIEISDADMSGDDAKNVFIVDNARAAFDNVLFDAVSLQVGRNSHVEIDASTFNEILSRDTSNGPFCTAVCVFDNAFARIENSNINGAESDSDLGGPVQAFRDSSIQLRGNSSITNSGTQPAVGVFFNSSLRNDNGSGNGNDTINGGLTVFGNSDADIRAATINGDADNDAVFVGGQSTLRTRATGSFGSNGVTIDGVSSEALLAVEASVVDMDDNTTVNNGAVVCEDTTQLVNDGFGGTRTVDCSVFHVEAGAGGNVGIGTRSPNAKLHVNGDARFDGTFSIASSRDVKRAFSDVQSREVLGRLLGLPITEWSYRGEERSVRHMGPVAEDFSAAFGLGADDKHVSPTDLSGVAFAAIQGLHQIVREREAEIEALEKQSRAKMHKAQEQIEELRRSRDELKERVARLEKLMGSEKSEK